MRCTKRLDNEVTFEDMNTFADIWLIVCNYKATEEEMTIKVYGIPTCGTVKKARAWLDNKGIEYTWIDIREAPPKKTQLKLWIKAFGFKPMRNTSGGAYRNLGPEKKSWEDAQWLDAFTQDAMLLKRPVVEVDREPIAVGFKAETYEEKFKP